MKKIIILAIPLIILLTGCSPYFSVDSEGCGILASNSKNYLIKRYRGDSINEVRLDSGKELREADLYVRQQAFKYKPSFEDGDLILAEFSTDIYNSCMNSNNIFYPRNILLILLILIILTPILFFLKRKKKLINHK